jgi:uncharacterized protein
MRARLQYLKSFLFIACLGLLVQCTAINPNQFGGRPLGSPYTMPAEAYIALANNHMGEEKQALLLLAAGRLVDEGRWQEANSILAQIKPASSLQTDKKNILIAKIDLLRKRPRTALNRLAAVRHADQLPLYEQAQFHELLAEAYKALGKSLESINERIKLDKILPDEASRANNRRALWVTLTSLPLAELNTLVIETPSGSELSGWMELALIARQDSAYPDKMLKKLTQWQQQYSNHPARSLLPSSLDSIQGRLYSKPKHIALILPFSGPLSGPGHAVQDGFMAAFRAHDSAASTTVRLYDTHRLGAAKAYHQAIAAGADYVVGPLSKPDVKTVAGMSHPVPTLLLNNVSTHTQDHAFQFGLSPPNEARQVASKARQASFSRALVIAPTGTWGNKILSAFSSEWRGLRGQIVDTLRFDPNNTENLNESIRELLQAVSDDDRKKQLKALAEDPDLERTPLRREDFDVIFLLAYPSNARQIMPLIRYYYAGKVPVYATSSVYAGTENTVADRDLNGITFSDMPWVLSHPNMGHRNWSERFNSYSRLYAMGMDSYTLSTELNALQLFPALGMGNETGTLYLTPNHRISRILSFGKFEQGVATPL